MIKEAYVSFEVAKLLKEKGFDESVHAWHNIFNKTNVEFSVGEAPDCNIPAPTHQMAMAWLRKMHNLFIVIDRHYFVEDKISHIVSGFKYSVEIKTIDTEYTYNGYKSYEQACEAALKYCLENLI